MSFGQLDMPAVGQSQAHWSHWWTTKRSTQQQPTDHPFDCPTDQPINHEYFINQRIKNNSYEFFIDGWSFFYRRALTLVTVYDILVSPGLVPIKLLTYLHSLMWEIPVGGCSVSTAQKSKLVAVTRKVRAILSVCPQVSTREIKHKWWQQISLSEIWNYCM